MLELARATARFILPSVCLACRLRDADGFLRGGVCGPCWDALPERGPERCPRCDEALPGLPSGAPCGRCVLDPPPFSRLRAAAPYAGPARDILLAFKFEGADYLAPHLAERMSRRLGPLAARPDEVAAVPSTPRARRQRGYNPAAELAAAVAERVGAPFRRRRLVKRRDTQVQSRLPLAERAANVRRAFAAAGPAPARVLLVDDVATSGATARECARALIRAGAREVEVWCFARASRADFFPEAA